MGPGWTFLPLPSLLVLFFLVHIIQVIFAGWNNFRVMVTGFETENINTKAEPIMPTEPINPKPETDEQAWRVTYWKTNKAQNIHRIYVPVSFLGSAIIGWQWLHRQPADHGAIQPLRKVLDANEFIFSSLFSKGISPKTYSPDLPLPHPRVNGKIDWTVLLIQQPGNCIL